MTASEPKNRCALLDTLRGLTVISMVVFHAVWDLVFLFGMDWEWYFGQGAYIWQQSICCTFIALSGFCSGMGEHTLRRGAVVFAMGAAVTLVTLLFMPEELIVFGVLTLIGSCMMLVGVLKKFLRKLPAVPALTAAVLLFGFTRHVDDGYVGLWTLQAAKLPEWLYQNYLTAYFGFPQRGFHSEDYFSLLPWVFLFLAGFFVYQLWGEKILQVRWKGIPGLNFIGRHALEIYMVHQPAVYGIFWLCSMVGR